MPLPVPPLRASAAHNQIGCLAGKYVLIECERERGNGVSSVPIIISVRDTVPATLAAGQRRGDNRILARWPMPQAATGRHGPQAATGHRPRCAPCGGAWCACRSATRVASAVYRRDPTEEQSCRFGAELESSCVSGSAAVRFAQRPSHPTRPRPRTSSGPGVVAGGVALGWYYCAPSSSAQLVGWQQCPAISEGAINLVI